MRAIANYTLLPDTESVFIVSPLQDCCQKLRNLFRRQWSSTTGFSSLGVVKTITKRRLTWDAKQVLLAAGVCSGWGCVIASTRATAQPYVYHFVHHFAAVGRLQANAMGSVAFNMGKLLRKKVSSM